MDEENEGIIATIAKTIENNWRLILVGIIILAIALNSSWPSNGESSQNTETSPTPTAAAEQSNQADQNKPQETTQVAENSTPTPAPTPVSVPSSAPTPTPAPTPAPVTTNTVSDGSTNVQVAAKSEGVTHLARRAVKEYLGSANENLSAEQKIYAEDFLRKKTGTKTLEVGEKIEFSVDLIKQGVEQAKGLNQKQIENLSKYVPLVRI
jgi:hypothetical protein